MIKWNCNFKIPGSTIQTNIALVEISHISVIENKTNIKITIFDENKENIIKQYEFLLNSNLTSEKEIYNILLDDFENSTLLL